MPANLFSGQTMRKLYQLRRFLLALSGADEEILAYVPSDRARFESLGWAILITSGMAMISMWFALSSALGINGIAAIPVAVFWGLVIMGIDRWLITSMPIDGSRKFAMAVPRVLLAVLLGTLISTPLVLRIFQSEIDAQMAQMQQNSYSSFLSNQQASQVNQQVITYNNELQQLNTVINSHGTQTGNNAADPQLVAYNKQLTQLQSQLNHWTTLKNQYYNAYICQLYGGPTCPKKGAGPAYKASYASYQQASKQVTSTQAQITNVQGEIQQRDQLLNSTSKNSQQQRYEEALTQRPIVQAEYNTSVQRRNQLQAAYYAQEQAAHGILMRLEALSQLSNGNPTVSAARILLFLLFLVIECLPVTVKLLQRPASTRPRSSRRRRRSGGTTKSSSAPGHACGQAASRRLARHRARLARRRCPRGRRLTPNRGQTRSGTAPGGCRPPPSSPRTRRRRRRSGTRVPVARAGAPITARPGRPTARSTAGVVPMTGAITGHSRIRTRRAGKVGTGTSAPTRASPRPGRTRP